MESCSLLSVIILAIWCKNPFAMALLDVETTTYIVPTEVISTTTQTKFIHSIYDCPYFTTNVIASDEVTYIINQGSVYKIQNQRLVNLINEDNFFFPMEHSLHFIEAGYIRNGSLILLVVNKRIYIYDPIPMQSDKFKLREGFPKKTPIDITMNGAIMINDKAHVFGHWAFVYRDEYLIYDERFNNVTTKVKIEINFPNFPNNSWVIGGHTTSSNGQKFLILFTNNNTDGTRVYTYDLERKNLVGGGKNLTEYLLNCH